MWIMTSRYAVWNSGIFPKIVKGKNICFLRLILLRSYVGLKQRKILCAPCTVQYKKTTLFWLHKWALWIRLAASYHWNCHIYTIIVRMLKYTKVILDPIVMVVEMVLLLVVLAVVMAVVVDSLPFIICK